MSSFAKCEGTISDLMSVAFLVEISESIRKNYDL
jgi:hypothetical protein